MLNMIVIQGRLTRDPELRRTTVKKHNGVCSYLARVPTEEAERELNPATRTLPVFYIGDQWRPKFVELEEE